MRNCNTGIFVRPTKRVEMISRQPSHGQAWEIAQEWAAKIVKLRMTDRFGVSVSPLPRGFWGVYLTDRSLPKDKNRESRG